MQEIVRREVIMSKESWLGFWSEKKSFFLNHSSFYSEQGGYFLGVKWPRHEADQTLKCQSLE
jgi:hypothetical protein